MYPYHTPLLKHHLEAIFFEFSFYIFMLKYHQNDKIQLQLYKKINQYIFPNTKILWSIFENFFSFKAIDIYQKLYNYI